jgi:hypothetical protein
MAAIITAVSVPTAIATVTGTATITAVSVPTAITPVSITTAVAVVPITPIIIRAIMIIATIIEN